MPPPEAVIVSAVPVPDRVRFAASVPKPLIVPLDVVVPSEMPEASLSVPPSSWILPAVTFCAALIVSAPAAPISNVWFRLVIEIAAAEVAVPSIFRSEAVAVAMTSTTPLSIVPNKSSVVLPLLPEAVSVVPV